MGKRGPGAPVPDGGKGKCPPVPVPMGGWTGSLTGTEDGVIEGVEEEDEVVEAEIDTDVSIGSAGVDELDTAGGGPGT